MARVPDAGRHRDGGGDRRLPPEGAARPQAQEARGDPRDRPRADPRLLRSTSGGRSAPGQVLVGFAAETEDLAANATRKLRAKNLDLIVGNDVAQPDAGFEVDTNRAIIVDADGGVDELPLLPKTELAGIILDRVAGAAR